MSNQPQTTKKIGLKAFLERASLVMFGLGFSAGMPNLLAGTSFTLGYWLRDAGISLTILGILSLATISYALKFLWAPLVDRVSLPIIDDMFGRRRSWILFTQILITCFLFFISTKDPNESLTIFASVAFCLAFVGATQDIAIDAWRIEVASDEDKLGVLTAIYQWGYRIAIVVTGAVPLYIAQYFNGDNYAHKGWGIAYAIMGCLMIIPIIATLLAPRELAKPAPRWKAPDDVPSRPVFEILEWIARLGIFLLGACFLGSGLGGNHLPIAWLVGDLYGGADAMKTAFEAKPWGVWQQVGYALFGLGLFVFAVMPISNIKTKPSAYFEDSFVKPIIDYFQRFENVAAIILIFICVYRVSEFLINISGSLYLDAGYTKADIATAQKIWGAIIAALGAGLAGWSILRFGIFKSLIVGAFSQPLSHIPFLLICYFGNANTPVLQALHIQPALWTAIGIDNISASYAGTCLIVYMSRLTHAGFTATQYALFSSLYALPGKLAASLSGRIVEASAKASHDGWISFITPIFSKIPPTSFAEPALKLGVDAPALATGYAVFYLYTVAMGIFGVIVAFIISKGKARQKVEQHA